MGRRNYSDETKAAVMASLLEGQSISHVAKTYKIPRGTVANWAGDVRGDARDQLDTTQKRKRDRIAGLIISYLEASLESLQKQVKAFGNAEWLRNQDASELAVLHGVQMDKAARLLELLSNGTSDDNTTQS